MTLGHTGSLQRCWRFQLALCPVPQCPSASAPPLPSPNHQGGPFRAMQLECDPVVVVVVGGVWVERSRWVVVWFPQQVFPKLGGNGEGQQGLSCLSLRHRGRTHCVSAKRMTSRPFRRPWTLKLKPKWRGGMFALFPNVGTSLGCGTEPGSPLGLGGCWTHPDKGQLWGCDGHQVCLGQLLLKGAGLWPDVV